MLPLLAAAICAGIVLLLAPFSVSEARTPEVTSPVTGSATYFDGLGSPYGGCGIPQSELETQNFVALNVYDTPGDYSFYPRPLPDSNSAKIGAWDNGRNCGRWVRVKVSDYCTGVNDGAPNQAFCRNGSWVGDAYNGATLDMIVADSCGDSNAWCRDDPYHLDLSKDSLNKFVRNGSPVGDMYPSHWNNRRLSWSYIPAPGYTGDIEIGFMKGAQRYWPAIAVSNLPNGIHGVEYYTGGAWVAAKMNSDMGQSFIIGGTASGGTQFQIRVRDASDAPVANGRVYSFELPQSCSSTCGDAYTAVRYTTSGPSTPPSASPSAAPSASPSAVPSASPSAVPSASPSSIPSASPSPSPLPGRSCSASASITSKWQGGYQGTVTVTAGSAAITGWTVRWTLPSGETISQAWNGALSVDATGVTVRNLSWNGGLSARSAASFGFLAQTSGTPSAPTVTCTAA